MEVFLEAVEPRGDFKEAYELFHRGVVVLVLKLEFWPLHPMTQDDVFEVLVLMERVRHFEAQDEH